LTGTPNPENDLQFVSQMLFLRGSFMGCKSYWEFRSKYYRPDPIAHYNWIPKPGVKTALRADVMKEALFMRRQDVGYPDSKVYEVRHISPPPKLIKAYSKLEKDFILEFGGVSKSTKWRLKQYAMLRRLASGFVDDQQCAWDGKFQELYSLLRGELKNEQVVVWFSFNAELMKATTDLLGMGITTGSMMGEHPREHRERNRQRFQDGIIRVLCVQQAVAQMGMDLSCSDTSIYFSEPVSHLARRQTEDRILSLQKTQPLLFLFLLTEGTVDEDIHDALAQKKLNSTMQLTQDLMKRMEERCAKTS